MVDRLRHWVGQPPLSISNVDMLIDVARILFIIIITIIIMGSFDRVIRNIVGLEVALVS